MTALQKDAAAQGCVRVWGEGGSGALLSSLPGGCGVQQEAGGRVGQEKEREKERIHPESASYFPIAVYF